MVRNRIIKEKKLGVAFLTIALTALLLLTACAPAPTAPGEEKKVVEIGAMVALTGAAGGPTSYSFYALQDYLDYFNEEEGIPGVTLELVWVDTATNEVREISAYRRFADRGIPLMITIIDSEKFVPWTERDEIPMIAQALTEAIMYPPGWIYSIYPTWAEHMLSGVNGFWTTGKRTGLPK